MMEEYIQVLTATEKREHAEKIALVLAKERLAGCIQIAGPVLSTYWWKGKVERAEEWLCLIKSRKALYEELERTVKEVHPYEIPEIIAMPIVAGSRDYLEWLRRELREE